MCNFTLSLGPMTVIGHCEINEKKGIGNIKLKSIMFTSVFSIGCYLPSYYITFSDQGHHVGNDIAIWLQAFIGKQTSS